MPKCVDCKNYQPEVGSSSAEKCKVNRSVAYHPESDLCCINFEPKQNSESKSSNLKDQIRQFESGATRDTDVGKLDYEGFISPLVLKRYAKYLNKHRVQSDGNLRDSDNWQKGIPIKEYMKSKSRHFIHTWLLHRNFPAFDEKGNKIDLEESLCAELFNTMGYLFEILKNKAEDNNVGRSD